MKGKIIFLSFLFLLECEWAENKNTVPEKYNISGNSDGEYNTLLSILLLKVYWCI